MSEVRRWLNFRIGELKCERNTLKNKLEMKQEEVNKVRQEIMDLEVSLNEFYLADVLVKEHHADGERGERIEPSEPNTPTPPPLPTLRDGYVIVDKPSHHKEFRPLGLEVVVCNSCGSMVQGLNAWFKQSKGYVCGDCFFSDKPPLPSKLIKVTAKGKNKTKVTISGTNRSDGVYECDTDHLLNATEDWERMKDKE